MAGFEVTLHGRFCTDPWGRNATEATARPEIRARSARTEPARAM